MTNTKIKIVIAVPSGSRVKYRVEFFTDDKLNLTEDYIDFASAKRKALLFADACIIDSSPKEVCICIPRMLCTDFIPAMSSK